MEDRTDKEGYYRLSPGERDQMLYTVTAQTTEILEHLKRHDTTFSEIERNFAKTCGLLGETKATADEAHERSVLNRQTLDKVIIGGLLAVTAGIFVLLV